MFGAFAPGQGYFGQVSPGGVATATRVGARLQVTLAVLTAIALRETAVTNVDVSAALIVQVDNSASLVEN